MKWMIFEHNEDSEKRHLVDSLNLFIFICLLIMTTLTIWLFKRVRFRFLHETGLSIIYGLIVGAIIKFTAPQHLPAIVVEDFSKLNTLAPAIVTNNDFYKNSAITTMPTNVTTSKSTENPKLPQEVIQLPSEEPELEEKAQFNPEVFFNVLLPPIIFHAGYSMKKKQFFQNIGSIAFYAFIGTLISSFTTALIMFTFLYVIKYQWDFIDCLKFGAIISATDPVSVLAIFNDMGVDADLYALVFGESVLNDAVAIILVSTVKTYKSEVLGFDGLAVVTSVAQFIVVFFGAFALGCSMGCITALITKFTHLRDYPLLETTLFVLMSYATFLAAEAAQMTGIVALLFCGVCQAHYTYNNMSPESRSRTKQLFELLNFLTENFVFLYIGVATFTFHKHVWNLPFIGFAFLSIIIARACNVYPISAILNLGRTNPIPASFQHFMMFSGLRGAMAFALSTRDTSSLKDCTIFSTTLLIVMTTIILSGGLTPQTLGWLNIKTAPTSTDDDETRAFDSLRNSPPRYVLNDLHLKQKPAGTCLFRLWHNFDHKFLMPLLTHSRPPLTDTMPHCCLPFARLFTTEQQKQQLIIGEGDGSEISLSSRNVDGNINDELMHSASVFNHNTADNEENSTANNNLNNSNNNLNNSNNNLNNSTNSLNDDINTNNNNNNDVAPSHNLVGRF